MAKKKSKVPADRGSEGVSSDSVWTGAPEGSHPIRPLAEQDWAAVNKQYRDMPDDQKPDPSTVAQLEVRSEEKS